MPGWHDTAVQLASPIAPVVTVMDPSGHSSHVELLLAPRTALYVLSGQGVHVLEALALANVPWGHSAQLAEPAPEYDPAAQGTQVLAVAAPEVADAVPGSQGRQAVAPSASEKVPGGQLRQSDSDVAPDVREKVPAGQYASQTTAAVKDEKVPGGHRTHCGRPGSALKVPGAHSVHAEDDDCAGRLL